MITRRLPYDLICGEQSSVAVRFCAGQARAEFTLLPRTRTTGRTTDSEYLFGAELLLHRSEMVPNPRVRGMVNFEQLRSCLIPFPDPETLPKESRKYSSQEPKEHRQTCTLVSLAYVAAAFLP
jgi:hypothetical protein